jgi:hypothetical protein
MTTLIIEHKLKANIKEIYPIIFDLEKFGSFHPYMTKVSKTGENLYLIQENVKILGFLPMKPVYSARVHEYQSGILYTSKLKKGVDLKISFDFIENWTENQTIVRETIEISANKIVGSILLATMQKAHLIVFQSIDNIIKSKKTNQPAAPPEL